MARAGCKQLVLGVIVNVMQQVDYHNGVVLVVEAQLTNIHTIKSHVGQAEQRRSFSRRLYAVRVEIDPAILDRLALIALGRAAGFSLDEIAGMFTPEGAPKIDRAALSAKADDIDGTIRRLAAMRDGLRHAAACRAPSHMECPTFRRILKAAADGTFARPRLTP